MVDSVGLPVLKGDFCAQMQYLVSVFELTQNYEIIQQFDFFLKCLDFEFPLAAKPVQGFRIQPQKHVFKQKPQIVFLCKSKVAFVESFFQCITIIFTGVCYRIFMKKFFTARASKFQKNCFQI